MENQEEGDFVQVGCALKKGREVTLSLWIERGMCGPSVELEETGGQWTGENGCPWLGIMVTGLGYW